MNLAEYSIRKRTVTMAVTLFMFFGGILAYTQMGRLEDPEFTIKQALVMTSYPGASARETTYEVTDHLETAIQQMGQVDKITSESKAGLSIIMVEIKSKYFKDSLPQIWDELRRKVSDAASGLPPGARPPLVIDDFGDVFGVLYAVTAPGFTYDELKDYADFLRRELLQVKDAAKVTIWGERQEAVHVEIPASRMKKLGISVQTLAQALSERNLALDSGRVRVGPEYVRITPSGGMNAVKDLGEIIISGTSGPKLVRLRDIADIKRGYVSPPGEIMRYNGEPSLALGVSLASGGNIVDLGKALTARLEQLDPLTPAGIQVNKIYYQPDYVTSAIDSFMINLGEAVAIVIVVLMVFMGRRSGLLIGFILLLTVLGTFVLMKTMDIQLHRISLGALIIALGMLVDNAIVVTEGMMIRIKGGMKGLTAAKETAAQNLWPLLGATAIAVLSFSPIGLSQDSSGEYCGTLFWVLLLSLGLSWLTALTTTPALCEWLYKPGAINENNKSPYGGRFFRVYRGLLNRCLRHRILTLSLMALLLGLALFGFTHVKKSFFPKSIKPIFYIDMWKPEGTDIRTTSEEMRDIEKILLKDERVSSAASFIGAGAPRFMLVYVPEKSYANYGQIMVQVKDYEDITAMLDEYREILKKSHPEAFFKLMRVRLGPGRDDPLEVRFSGPDPEELRRIAAKAEEILMTDAAARGVRHNWREKAKTLRPVLAEANARRLGLTRQSTAQALKAHFSGSTVGIYRESDKLLPIILRAPENERNDASSLGSTQVFAPAAGKMVPLSQIVSRVETSSEDSLLRTRNRSLCITVSCEPAEGLASELFERIRPKIEKIELKPGYTMEWGGEYEDSTEAQEGLASSLPSALVLMVLITIGLFNAVRQSLVIWLTVPLALIGVTVALLATGEPFGFLAILGFLSLMGMLIKNSIVLVDQIDINIRENIPRLSAILDASVSRMRPVLMASSTTVLGMLPLAWDPFFSSMAVTIMGGLTFATVLTLIVAPTLYATLFGVRRNEIRTE